MKNVKASLGKIVFVESFGEYLGHILGELLGKTIVAVIVIVFKERSGSAECHLIFST